MNHYKTCSQCHVEKSVDEFGISGHNKDGQPQRRPACKPCVASAALQRGRLAGRSPNGTVEGDTKVCTRCQQRLHISLFGMNGHSKAGTPIRQSKCIACTTEAARERRIKLGIPARTKVVNGNKLCAQCGETKPVEEFTKRNGLLNSDGSVKYMWCKSCTRLRQNEKRYKMLGILPAKAKEMLASQNDLCAVCQSAPATHLDHDHATGLARAFLCNSCNSALGHMEDNPDRLRAGAAYLESFVDSEPNSATVSA